MNISFCKLDIYCVCEWCGILKHFFNLLLMWKPSKGHRLICRNGSQWEYCRKRQRNPKEKLRWSEKCENSNKETEIIENIWSIMLLFSRQVVSGSLQPYGLQHTRLLRPSPSPKFCPSSCPLHQWCHPVISSSEAFFSFCPQPFPILGTFPMNQLFASDDWNTGVSNSVPVLPTSIQGWFPLRLTSLIFMLSKGLSGVFSSTIVLRHQFFGALPSLKSSSHNYMRPLGRP